MAQSVGGVYIDLGLNSARYQEGLRKAKGELGKFSAETKRLAGVARAALAGVGDGLALGLAGLGVSGAVAGIKAVTSQIAGLAAEAQRAGIGVEAFQELSYAAQGALVGVDALTDGIKEMQLRADEFIVTGAGGGAEAFQRLGYSADELKAKLADPAALFEEVIDKIGRLDKAAQIRIADEIFGGTGGEQFVRLVDQGAGYIRLMRQEARDTGNVLDKELVQRAVEIDREFARIASTVGTNLKDVLVSVVYLMRDFLSMLNATESQSNDAIQRRIDLARAAVDNMKKSTLAFYAGGGDQGIASREAEIAKLEALLSKRRATSVTVGASGGLGDLSKVQRAGAGPSAAQQVEKLSKAYEQIILSVDQRIGQIRTEGEALGLTTAAAEALRMQTDLLSAAERAGITLSQAQREELAAKAQEYGRLVEAVDNAAQAQQMVDDIGRDVAGGLISDLRQGVSAADAFANAVQRLGDRLSDLALDALFGGGSSGAGGLLSQLFGLGGGIVKAAGGGMVRGPGTGRSDSIPARLSNGEFVVNAGATRQHRALLEAVNSGAALHLAAGGFVGAPSMPSAAGRGQSSPVFAPVYNIDARGSQMSEQQFQRILDENNRKQASTILSQVSGRVAEDRMRTGAQRGI